MIYVFDDCSLDTERRELRLRTKLVPLEPQVFDLLVYLISNRERVASKDNLIAAVWGGRIVSESAISSKITAVRQAIGDSGEEQRMIKTLPRKGFRFVGTVQEVPGPDHSPDGQASTVTPRATPTHPDRPSIAALPFINLSGDPEQDYFADGMVEDIITALSRFRWLFVIARNSSFTYKGRAVDVKQVGRELGVRYLLEGSVRKSANRIRIAGQLIDAASGVHLWADRFEGAIEDVFELQDQVTASVVGAIAPRVIQVEIDRARRKPTENLDAYDSLLRGLASFRKWTRKGKDEALRLCFKAIELDPDYSLAYAAAASCIADRKGFGWVIDRERGVAEASRLARRAVQLGNDDATVLGMAGYTLAYVSKELDDGAAFLDRALSINPNSALTWSYSGWVKVWIGEPDLAIEHFAQAMRLSPIDPGLSGMQQGTAHAHFFAGRYDEAVSWAKMALRERPDGHAGLRIAAASCALAGRGEEAKRLIAQLLEIDPALRISSILQNVLGPYRKPEHSAKYADALRKAGLPE
jgi:TolB-like protein/Tfp pilus assembly protein PilF